MASGDFGIGAQVSMDVIVAEIHAALGIMTPQQAPEPETEERRHFVIAEEDVALAMELKSALEGQNRAISVVEFRTAGEALDWLASNEADVLLTSLEFSEGVSGSELVRALVARPDRRCQIVATSNRTRAEAGAESLARSNVFFLPKPINVPFAVGMLTGLLGSRIAAPRTTRRLLAAGETLFREGDAGTEVFQVVSGILEVSLGEGVSRRVLNRMEPGELFGEMSFLTGAKRSATITAVSPTELIQVNTAELQDFLARQPEWLRQMIDNIAVRLRRANARAES
jgi:CheY-like chemotaxis protein